MCIWTINWYPYISMNMEILFLNYSHLNERMEVMVGDTTQDFSFHYQLNFDVNCYSLTEKIIVFID